MKHKIDPPEKPPPASSLCASNIEVIVGVENDELPPSERFVAWAEAALNGLNAEVAIRIVSTQEMIQLNGEFREQHAPTNVLSFPSQLSDSGLLSAEIMNEFNSLGDIAICAEVVAREALEQHKAPVAHWAHMIVHGILHLRGFDHETDKQATAMESEEVRILASMGFDNPYLSNDRHSHDGVMVNHE